MTVLHEAQTLEVRLDDGVATLVLTRPELLNRFDQDVHNDFTAALGAIEESELVRAVVIASTGKVFSAGGDFDFMLKANTDLAFLLHHAEVGKQLLMSLVDLQVPVVAAVQGPAIGLGATVALACDCVVAAKGVTLADPHVRVGLVAGDGGCLVWPMALGMTRARRYLLTGHALTAEDGYQFGAVTDLVDRSEDVGDTAQQLARELASLPPIAVQGTKRALRNAMRARANEVVDVAMANEVASASSQDLVEAIAAFREKRRGSYVGG
ncbi:Enoyl-CoA hydratase [Mycolicibacterium fortuitum]|uniref:Enoyl-CoA hydratase n=1 Tax=Mycolicibacterium fortuitum TaxID=1766 RepID=A0A0N9XQ68_MYCFO|nr:enoyl-CoA hydratase/isomerase family protein [Mycolicibacterium fortuitum]ALI25846.1 Enoyl-CoA hydratase [Mycolicibacterium fortuitum]